MQKSNYTRLFYSVFPWLAFAILMWLAYFANQFYNLEYSHFGIFPRDLSGLRGILFSPFIHGSFEHLGNNTLPLIILGSAVFYFYGKLGVKVVAILYLLTGLLVWLSARESFHIGASGLVYAFAGFLFMSGILRKAKNLVALSLLVAFMYGSLFWGIFPVKERISWESHLWGGVAGFVLAWYYRKEGPQRKRYDWEFEEDEEEDELANWNKENVSIQNNANDSIQSKPKNRIVIRYVYKSKNDNKEGDNT